MLSSEWFFAGLGLATGFGLLLVTVNRILSYLHGRPVKALVAVTGFVLFPLGFCWLAYAGGRAGQVTVAVVALGLAVGELRRVALRREYHASLPVEQTGPELSLSRPITTTDLRLARYVIPVGRREGVTRRRLRIAHISDLHVNSHLPVAYYQEAMDRANQTGADLVFITGDFVNNLEEAHYLPGLLAGLQSRWGVFAVLGNHDFWAGASQVRRLVRSAGVQVLGNGWQRIHVDGVGNVLLIGCEEPWSQDRWQAPAVQRGDLVLALSHTADHVYRLNKLGTVAVFSGHYHAGQFCLPFLGPLFVPSRYGRRFCHGHFIVGGTHLFVSAGAGSAEPALRLYCPPDIFIVDLVFE